MFHKIHKVLLNWGLFYKNVILLRILLLNIIG